MTKQYGIFGWPVAHSRSPEMQAAAFRSAGLDATYERFAVKPEDLKSELARLQSSGLQGANVTLPHKQAVMELLDEVTPQAKAIGAVNTLVRQAGGEGEGEGFVGHNTDAPGLARSLIEAGVNLQGIRVVVLGAGGAARAAVVGLAGAGAARIILHARRPEAAAKMGGELAAICGTATHLGLGDLADALTTTDLLVQATSATLEGNAQAAEFAASLPIERMPEGSAVVDLVYKPRETTVLAKARARGLKVVDGLGMLIHQGALAFELWTGRPADVAAMTAALEAP